ncbi:A-kinase anchor protein 17B-like [Pyxicephalus adspersus]|uniref:A-kinase anchor protein 17B-like n=1 Tax=Pyxicephalus adspersus TaxID=30357 RepID=UPI003B5C55F2
MTVTPVYDDSEAVELCATYHLYLKPRAKLIITIILPDETDQCRPVSNWDILEQMKNLVAPDYFSSLRIVKSTKELIRLEGETDTTQLCQIFLEKINGKTLQINNLSDPARLEVHKAPLESPTIEKAKVIMPEQKGDIEDTMDHSTKPSCIHLEGLPCKWFSEWNANIDKPSEKMLKSAFEKYGKIVFIDIPMLDPYREGNVGSPVTPGSLQAFEAFIQYEDKSSAINAVCSLQGMKLMYAAEDGKSLACDFKVCLDTTNHFSEQAVNKRAAERLRLQELELQRKQEKEEDERKRKMEEKKARARRRKARLKRKLQRQKREQKAAQQKEACPEDEIEDTQEWEDRKLILAQRRLESIKLFSVLLDKVNDLVQVNRLEEEQIKCEIEAVFSDFSVSTYSENSKVVSPHVTTEDEHSQHETEMEAEHKIVEIKLDKDNSEAHRPRLDILPDSISQNWNYEEVCPTLVGAHEPYDPPQNFYEHRTFKLSHFQQVHSNRPSKKRKIYETDEFINYLLNYYHYPEYARMFLETNEGWSEPMCKRVVLWKGNSFQIRLQNINSHFAEMNSIPELDEGAEDDNSRRTENVQNSLENLEETLLCKKDTNELQKDVTESEHKILVKREKLQLGKKSEKVYQKIWDAEEDSQSLESGSELKKVLEEISSTSEYFSDELSATSSKQLNIKRAVRKQRKLKQTKKSRQRSVSGNQICHHEDLLGQLLHSYCQRLKKHSKHKIPKAYRRKPILHNQCESETTESDSDTVVEVQRTRKRKRPRIRNHSTCLEEKKCKKEIYSSSDSENSLESPHQKKRNMCRHQHNGKPKGKKHKAADFDEKPKRNWDYYCVENVSESPEQEESSWIGEETQSSYSMSSSLQTGENEQFEVCPKGLSANYWDWNHHFFPASKS